MKSLLYRILFLLALLLLIAPSAFAEDLLKVGDKAPEFSATTYDGKAFSLKEATKESPVLLVFIRGFG
jgi:hypothetical protein